MTVEQGGSYRAGLHSPPLRPEKQSREENQMHSQSSMYVCMHVSR